MHARMSDVFLSFITIILGYGVYGSQSERPNVIIFLADDLGWNDIGFHGSNQIPTPNIDALAYSGVILNNYYTMPLCTPSRSALMTGRHPIHTGMQHEVLNANEPWGLPLDVTTLAEYMQQMNYSTNLVGKWHLGQFHSNYTPTSRGFDYHYGYWGGHQDYYDHTLQEQPGYWGYDMRRNMDIDWQSYGKYSTDLFTEEAERIIREHDTSRPLFLTVAHLAVHSSNPYQSLQAPENVVNDFQYIKDYNRRIFAGMVSVLDESVGRVVTVLREAGILDNSIIIFSSDNGGPANGFNSNAASNWPLRGVKDTIWEGGVRAASFIWSPLIPGPSRISNNLMHIQDWLPTLLSAVNYTEELPSDLDGHNMWPVLTQNGSQPYEELLINIDNIRGFAAVRKGNWKLVKGATWNGQWDGWYGPSGRDAEYYYNWTSVTSSPVAAALESTTRPLPLFDILELRSEATVFCNMTHANSVYYDTEPEDTDITVITPCNHSLGGCLYNIANDPCELDNVAEKFPDQLAEMLALLEQYNATYIEPRNQPVDPLSNPKYWNYTWSNWMDYQRPVLVK